jgi:hypothetical protein
MEKDFYASIKIISGEEIFSKVCSYDENDSNILMIENPVVIEEISIKEFKKTALRFEPWFKFSTESIFILDMDKIVTITEVDEPILINLYNKYLREKDRVTTKSELNSDMGYISSVSKARELLEKLYNSST